MKPSITALAVACAVLRGDAMLRVGLCNLSWPGV
jgi:hypothetical protein